MKKIRKVFSPQYVNNIFFTLLNYPIFYFSIGNDEKVLCKIMFFSKTGSFLQIKLFDEKNTKSIFTSLC